jgi:hypothetical protein
MALILTWEIDMDDMNNSIQEELDYDVIKQMDKKAFFKLIEDNNIDLDEVVKKKKDRNVNFHRFNLLVREQCEKGHLNIVEIAVYLYTDYFKTNDVLECFDEYNNYDLRCEISNKFGLTTRKSVLSKFLNIW